MGIDLQEQWFRGLTELRYAGTAKRIRALLDRQTVVDTRDALLVYEPRRVVPWYAVPPGDLHLDLTEHIPVPVPECGDRCCRLITMSGTPCQVGRCTWTATVRWLTGLTIPILAAA